MALYCRLPGALGAATCLPASGLSQPLHTGHQLPGFSVAPSNQASALAGSLSLTQWLRLPFAGGLMTPAM